MRFSSGFLLFDLDGTLVDSTQQISNCWRSWAIENNLNPDVVDVLSRGRTAKETIKLAFAAEAKADVDKLTRDFIQSEIKATFNLTPIFHSKQLLASLPPDRWGVVTSATNSLALARLNSAGLPIPKVLVTSELVERGKPSPDGFILAAKLLSAKPSDCIVFEDSLSGIQAALAAEMQVIQVNGNTAVSGVSCSISNFEGVRVEQDLSSLIVLVEKLVRK